jgi:hypothetical protein
VAILPEVELPQFQVMGYRKRAYTYALTTGKADALIASKFASRSKVGQPLESQVESGVGISADRRR